MGTDIKPAFGLADFETALIRHGIIPAAAINDAGGYDEGETRDAVLSAYEDLAFPHDNGTLVAGAT